MFLGNIKWTGLKSLPPVPCMLQRRFYTGQFLPSNSLFSNCQVNDRLDLTWLSCLKWWRWLSLCASVDMWITKAWPRVQKIEGRNMKNPMHIPRIFSRISPCLKSDWKPAGCCQGPPAFLVSKVHHYPEGCSRFLHHQHHQHPSRRLYKSLQGVVRWTVGSYQTSQASPLSSS